MKNFSEGFLRFCAGRFRYRLGFRFPGGGGRQQGSFGGSFADLFGLSHNKREDAPIRLIPSSAGLKGTLRHWGQK